MNDILDNLIKEDQGIKEEKQNIKGLISTRIYLNTIKKAYTAIKESGVEAQYLEKIKVNM